MKVHTRVNFATDDATRMERYHFIYRNDVHCYRQYGWRGWLYIILKDIYTLLNILLNARGSRVKKMKIVVKGFIEGLNFKPYIEMVE